LPSIPKQSLVATESIFSYLGRVEQYKGYWVSSFAFMTYGYGNDWYARGCVSKIEPSGYTVDVNRFEPSDVFTSKEEAEAHGLKLARDWVDCRKD
jgi:hypothetical protein